MRIAKKIARIVAIVLVAALALYLVAMNVFLRTRLFRSLIGSDPLSLLVDYTSAYSIVPGVIHVKGLSIRGSDSNVEWILRIDQVDFRVSFLGLLHRRFQANHVHGDGLSMRLRQKVDWITPADEAELPPVPGFEDPPMRAVGPPPTPLTDANYNLWTIDLEDVDAEHVRELWIDERRFAGDLGIHGRWLFRPIRWLEVGPATVQFNGVDCTLGMAEPLVSDVRGRLDTTIFGFDVRAVPLARLPHQISLSGDVRGMGHMANLLGAMLGSDMNDVESSDSTIAMKLAIDRGVVKPATSLDVAPFDATIHSKGPDLQAHWSMSVAAAEDGQSLQAVAASTDLRIVDGKREAGSADRLAASVTVAHLDLGNLSDRLDLRDVRLEAREVATKSGPIEVSLASLDTTVDRVGVNSDAEGVPVIDLSRANVSLRNLRVDSSGTIVWAPSFESHTEHMAFGSPGMLGIVDVDVPDIRFSALESFVPLLPIPPSIHVQRGQVRASANLAVDVGRKSATGTLSAWVTGLRLQIGPKTLDGTLTVQAHAKQEGSATDLSGSLVDFRDAAGSGSNGWWGHVDLPKGAMTLNHGLRFNGQIVAKAKDAGPALAMVADTTAIPSWALNIVSTDRLTATGDLVVAPEILEARSVRAMGDGVGVGFEFAKLPEASEWTLLVETGPLRAGVDTVQGKTSVQLVDAEPWFLQRAASLRAIEKRYE